MTKLSAVLTAHNEGFLAGPAIRSMWSALTCWEAAGGEVEVVAVLDRPDELTRAVIQSAVGDTGNVIVTDLGDPGLARNRGVQAATGEYVAFLDGDDLWSANWLVSGVEALQAGPQLIAHSEVNVIFGDEQYLWWHADSRSADFDPEYLLLGNYWDAMSLAPRHVYLQFPFVRNDLASGFGHEDWLFNCETLSSGIHHIPVAGTVHFKRRRPASQLSRCSSNDVVVRPNAMTRFADIQALAHRGVIGPV